MQTVKKTAATAKEKASNVAAKAEEKIEKGHASTQEKLDKTIAHDKEGKQSAKDQKRAKQSEVEHATHAKTAQNKVGAANLKDDIHQQHRPPPPSAEEIAAANV